MQWHCSVGMAKSGIRWQGPTGFVMKAKAIKKKV
jgi:hypothetical protein